MMTESIGLSSKVLNNSKKKLIRNPQINTYIFIDSIIYKKKCNQHKSCFMKRYGFTFKPNTINIRTLREVFQLRKLIYLFLKSFLISADQNKIIWLEIYGDWMERCQGL